MGKCSTARHPSSATGRFTNRPGHGPLTEVTTPDRTKCSPASRLHSSASHTERPTGPHWIGRARQPCGLHATPGAGPGAMQRFVASGPARRAQSGKWQTSGESTALPPLGLEVSSAVRYLSPQARHTVEPPITIRGFLCDVVLNLGVGEDEEGLIANSFDDDLC